MLAITTPGLFAFSGSKSGAIRIYRRRLQQIIAIDQPWAVPFVVQLLGEYVIEIVELIEAAFPAVNAGRFSEFVLENPKFIATTRRRATSYWDCYYRSRFPELRTYPATTALNAIEQMARSD